MFGRKIDGCSEGLEIEKAGKSVCQGVREPDEFGKELRKSGDPRGEENLEWLLHSGILRKQNASKSEGRKDIIEPRRRSGARKCGGSM